MESGKNLKGILKNRKNKIKVSFIEANIYTYSQMNVVNNPISFVELGNDNCFTLDLLVAHFSKQLKKDISSCNIYIKEVNDMILLSSDTKYTLVSEQDYNYFSENEDFNIVHLKGDSEKPNFINIIISAQSNHFLNDDNSKYNDMLLNINKQISDIKYIIENKVVSLDKKRISLVDDIENIHLENNKSMVIHNNNIIYNDDMKYVDILFIYSNPLVHQKNNSNIYSDSGNILNIEVEFNELVKSIYNKKVRIKYIPADLEAIELQNHDAPKILHISSHGYYNSEKKFCLYFEKNGKVSECTASNLQNVLGLMSMKDNNFDYEEKSDKLSENISFNGSLGRYNTNPEDANLLKPTTSNIYNFKNKSMSTFSMNSKNLGSITELVVIAACHSEDIGDVFFEFGIKCMVVIHSKVGINDEASIKFTSHFYKYLLEGETINSAFNRCLLEVKNDLKEECLYPCCCNHSHTNKCNYKSNHHNLHIKSCRCTDLPYNLHYNYCELGQKIKNQYNSIPNTESDLINACCCKPHDFPHDETKKFLIIFKDNKIEEYGNRRIFPKQKDDNFNSKVEGNYYKNNKCLDVDYVPFMYSRCQIIYEVVEYFLKSNNYWCNKKRLITLYSSQNRGNGKILVAKLCAKYLWERKKIDKVFFIERNSYNDYDELLEKISKYLKIDLYKISKGNFDEEEIINNDLNKTEHLIMLEINFNSVLKNQFNTLFDILFIFPKLWIFCSSEEIFDNNYEKAFDVLDIKDQHVDKYFRHGLKNDFKRISEDYFYPYLKEIVSGNITLIQKATELIQQNQPINNVISELKTLSSVYVNDNLDYTSIIESVFNLAPSICIIFTFTPNGIGKSYLIKALLPEYSSELGKINNLISMNLISKHTVDDVEVFTLKKNKEKLMTALLTYISQDDENKIKAFDVKIVFKTIENLFKYYKKILKCIIRHNKNINIYEFSVALDYGIWRRVMTSEGTGMTKFKKRDIVITGEDRKEIIRIIENILFLKDFMNMDVFIYNLNDNEKLLSYLSDIILCIKYILKNNMMKTQNKTKNNYENIIELFNNTLKDYIPNYYIASIRNAIYDKFYNKNLNHIPLEFSKNFNCLYLRQSVEIEVKLLNFYIKHIYPLEQQQNINLDANKLDNSCINFSEGMKNDLMELKEILYKIDKKFIDPSLFESMLNSGKSSDEIDGKKSINKNSKEQIFNKEKYRLNESDDTDSNCKNSAGENMNYRRSKTTTIMNNQINKIKNKEVIYEMTVVRLQAIIIDTMIRLDSQNKKDYSYIIHMLSNLFRSCLHSVTKNDHILLWVITKFESYFDVSDLFSRNLASEMIQETCNFNISDYNFNVFNQVCVVQKLISEKKDLFDQNIIRIFYSNSLVVNKNNNLKIVLEDKIIPLNPAESIINHLEQNKVNKRMSFYEHILTRENYISEFKKNGKICAFFSEYNSIADNYILESNEKIGSAEKFDKVYELLKNESSVIKYDIVILCFPNSKNVIEAMKKFKGIKYFINFNVDSSFVDLFSLSFKQNYNHLILEFVKDFVAEMLNNPHFNTESDKINSNIIKTTSYDINAIIDEKSKISKEKTDSDTDSAFSDNENRKSKLTLYDETIEKIFLKVKEKLYDKICQFIKSLPIDASDLSSFSSFDKLIEPKLVINESSDRNEIGVYENGFIKKCYETEKFYFNDYSEIESTKADIYFRKKEMNTFINNYLLKSDSNNSNLHNIINVHGIKGVGKDNFIYHCLNYFGQRSPLSKFKYYFYLLNLNSIFRDIPSNNVKGKNEKNEKPVDDKILSEHFEKIFEEIEFPKYNHLYEKRSNANTNKFIENNYNLVIILNKCDGYSSNLLYSIIAHITYSLNNKRKLVIKIILISVNKLVLELENKHKSTLDYYHLKTWDESDESQYYSERFLFSRLNLQDSFKINQKFYSSEVLAHLRKEIKSINPPILKTARNLIILANTKNNKIMKGLINLQKEFEKKMETNTNIGNSKNAINSSSAIGLHELKKYKFYKEILKKSEEERASTVNNHVNFINNPFGRKSIFNESLANYKKLSTMEQIDEYPNKKTENELRLDLIKLKSDNKYNSKDNKNMTETFYKKATNFNMSNLEMKKENSKNSNKGFDMSLIGKDKLNNERADEYDDIDINNIAKKKSYKEDDINNIPQISHTTISFKSSFKNEKSEKKEIEDMPKESSLSFDIKKSENSTERKEITDIKEKDKIGKNNSSGKESLLFFNPLLKK